MKDMSVQNLANLINRKGPNEFNQADLAEVIPYPELGPIFYITIGLGFKAAAEATNTDFSSWSIGEFRVDDQTQSELPESMSTANVILRGPTKSSVQITYDNGGKSGFVLLDDEPVMSWA